jgi:hypothetical protein
MVRAMARTSMPRSPEELEALVAQQQEELDRRQEMIDERDSLIAFYREWKRLVDSQRFGAKSERFEAGPAQIHHLRRHVPRLWSGTAGAGDRQAALGQAIGHAAALGR